MFGERQVLCVEVVLITGDVAGRAALHLAGGMRKPVPDGLAFAVLVPRSFHLIGGGSSAPEESLGKASGLDLGLGNRTGHRLLDGRVIRNGQLASRKQRSAGRSERSLHEFATIHGVSTCPGGNVSLRKSASQTF